MGAVYEIPLSTQQELLNVTLAGTTYQLRVMYNTVMSVWTVDLSDSSGNLIIGSIPLVTGVDLLSAYPDLNIGGRLYAATDHTPSQPPTVANLGTTGHLYFVVYP